MYAFDDHKRKVQEAKAVVCDEHHGRVIPSYTKPLRAKEGKTKKGCNCYPFNDVIFLVGNVRIFDNNSSCKK